MLRYPDLVEAECSHRLDQDDDVVLVCRSGQRSTKAQTLLRNAGLTSGRVLDKGITDWEGQGFAVDRGAQRWDLERQVRLVAGSIVLSSVLGSIAVPRLKWVAAGIGTIATLASFDESAADELNPNPGLAVDAASGGVLGSGGFSKTLTAYLVYFAATRVNLENPLLRIPVLAVAAAFSAITPVRKIATRASIRKPSTCK